MAVRVLLPEVVKITLQFPVPLERVMLQFVSAPVMATVPLGIGPQALVTLTATVTVAPVIDGSGVSAVISVIVSACITKWSFESLLLVWPSSPA